MAEWITHEIYIKRNYSIQERNEVRREKAWKMVEERCKEREREGRRE